MKFIRYIFIAALIYFLAVSVYGLIEPNIAVTVDSSSSEIEAPVLLPSNHADLVAAYRVAIGPWILLMVFILSGWVFWNSRKIVLGLSLASFAVLGYLVFTNLKSLGYTMRQSFSALHQGYEFPFLGQSLFCLVALVALLTSIWINQSKAASSTPLES